MSYSTSIEEEGNLMRAMGEHCVCAASLKDLGPGGCLVVQLEGLTLALFRVEDRVHAVDNRCPHLGFPLSRGSVCDGILTCPWHHARFDLESGGTFDPWADDVQSYSVELRGDEVWLDLSPAADRRESSLGRLRQGLERNIPLVLGKSVLSLLSAEGDPLEAFRLGLGFGARYRQVGWGPGLTILTCMARMLPHLRPDDRARALCHGLSAVADECAGSAPRHPVATLPGAASSWERLGFWFRQFVEVRDAEGAERCLATAVEAEMPPRQVAEMLFTAATDHRYVQTGHVVDFTNKAFEALDLAGWENAGIVLTSLTPAYAGASRMEESNAWRHPVDLVALLEGAFDELPAAVAEGGRNGADRPPHPDLVPVLLSDRPSDILGALLEALRRGCSWDVVAGAVTHAAALRIARLHTSNEFGDWDRALHTFSFASAIQRGLQRAGSASLLRGVMDAAISVYLDRFLNTPPARLPECPVPAGGAPALLAQVPRLLDQRQQVNAAGALVSAYLSMDGDVGPMVSALAANLLREDRDFHTIQALEAAFTHLSALPGTPAGADLLVAAARYLAAHSPTVRSHEQNFSVAERLHRGERLYEEE
ncbi:MAG TPA: Rieske (2Fe-2S) protein [Armatimonadota bacterium]